MSFPSRLFPDMPLSPAVVKRSDTSLLTTRTRARIPPGGSIRSSVDRARAAGFVRTMRRLRFRLFPAGAFLDPESSGGEDIRYFACHARDAGSNPVGSIMQARSSMVERVTERYRLFPGRLWMESLAVVKTTRTSMGERPAERHGRSRVRSTPALKAVAQQDTRKGNACSDVPR